MIRSFLSFFLFSFASINDKFIVYLDEEDDEDAIHSLECGTGNPFETNLPLNSLSADDDAASAQIYALPPIAGIITANKVHLLPGNPIDRSRIQSADHPDYDQGSEPPNGFEIAIHGVIRKISVKPPGGKRSKRAGTDPDESFSRLHRSVLLEHYPQHGTCASYCDFEKVENMVYNGGSSLSQFLAVPKDLLVPPPSYFFC